MRDTRTDRASVLIIGTVVLIFLASIVLFTGCSKGSSDPSSGKHRTLYLYNWTYYTPQKIIDLFEKEYGVDVVLDVYASNEDMFAKLRAYNGGYDVVVPSADYVSIMIRLGMLEKLDRSAMPNLSNINPWVLSLASYDPEMDYAVPYFLGAAGIAVNTDKVKDYVRDWSLFADKRYAGRMQLLDDMVEVIGIAQKSLGYSVNSRDEQEIELAGKLVNEQWKPNIVKFDSEGFGKAFSQGEYWVSHAFPEVIFSELPVRSWDKVDFFLPEQGGPMYLDSMVILKGSPNADIAHAFINFFHRPDIYAIFLDEFHFAPTVNPAAKQYMETTPFYDKEDVMNYELKLDLGSDLEKYDRVWQTIRYWQ